MEYHTTTVINETYKLSNSYKDFLPIKLPLTTDENIKESEELLENRV